MAKFKGLRCDLIIDVMWTSYDILPVKRKTMCMHEKKEKGKLNGKVEVYLNYPHLVVR